MDDAFGVDDIVIGSLYTSVSLLILLVYAPCIYVMRTDASIKHNSCFRLMFHMGISDLIQISGHFIYGIWAMTGIAYTVPYWINKIVGALFPSLGWHSYITLVNVLAFNRCLVLLANKSRYGSIFSLTATTFWIAISWAIAFVWTAFYLSPWSSVIYTAELFGYYWDFALSLTPALVRASWWNCVFNQGLVILWYAIAIVSLKVQLNDISPERRKQERALWRLAAVIGATLLLSDQYWHNIQYWVCPHTKYCYAVGNMVMLTNNAVNPICYLTINKTISKKVFKMFKLKSNRVVSQTQKSNNNTAGTRRAVPATTGNTPT